MFWHMCVLVCIYMYYWYQYVHKQYQQRQYIPIRAEHMQIHNIRVILVCIDPYIVILHMLSTYWSVLKLLVWFMHVLIPIVHVYTY